MRLSAHDLACIIEAKSIIEKNSSIHYNIKAIAQKVGLGTTKLKAGFKSRYGMGVYEFLSDYRMQNAMDLLMNTDKTIKQIAKAAGYKHTNNFSTAFKKRFGYSPAKAKRN